MRPEFSLDQRKVGNSPVLRLPHIIVASGMQGTGVSTIAGLLQLHAPSLKVVDADARWTDISEACMPGFARCLVITTHDIISVSSAYALVKLVRDRFPDAMVGEDAVFAVQDLAARLDEELSAPVDTSAIRRAERRMIQ